MIILIEILLILILAMIMLTLIVDETNHKKRTKHLVKLKGYWDGKERRRVMRHNVNLDVRYSINHAFKNTTSRDISSHGVGLILEEKLERKTPLSVEIVINGNNEPIKAKARVMWAKEAFDEEKFTPKRLFHTGIKFVRFTNTLQEKKLFDYIRTLEKDSPHY
ncbi:MAG: PilZ domain-containing protein [Candidatus Omnitrophica bacterium]|nr:PilZ domain-containing protein [Candidatus Omnitrophota bacterium]